MSEHFGMCLDFICYFNDLTLTIAMILKKKAMKLH